MFVLPVAKVAPLAVSQSKETEEGDLGTKSLGLLLQRYLTTYFSFPLMAVLISINFHKIKAKIIKGALIYRSPLEILPIFTNVLEQCNQMVAKDSPSAPPCYVQT